MSLVIGVRCKNGCSVIADLRNTIKEDGKIIYEDNFEKVVKCDDYLLYNHGYNRIENVDWKQRWQDLTPDDSNPVYKDLLDEMKTKPDKSAYYVFISKNMLYEVAIKVKDGVRITDFLPDDRIVSGNGSKYVDTKKLLENLSKRKCNKVFKNLKQTFNNAYARMSYLSGREFSKRYKVYQHES